MLADRPTTGLLELGVRMSSSMVPNHEGANTMPRFDAFMRFLLEKLATVLRKKVR